MKCLFIRCSFLLSAFLFILSNASAQVTDIDGNTYKTVKIGNQKWMAENLRVKKFNNGDTIIEVESRVSILWDSDFDHNAPWLNEDEGGVVYNSHVVRDSLNVCPVGWRVPVENDWKVLAETLGGKGVAAKKMKSATGWPEVCNATNESGFNAKPYAVYNITLEGLKHMIEFSKAASWWPHVYMYSNDGKDELEYFTIDGNRLFFYWPEGYDNTDYIRCVRDNN